MEHAHVVLKDGRNLEFPLVRTWRQIAEKEFNGNEVAYVKQQAINWFGEEEIASSMDIVSVRVAR